MLGFDPSVFDASTGVDRVTSRLAGEPGEPRFMPMDVYRQGDHYVLNADLPGLDPGSVRIDVDNGILTIQGQRTPAAAEQEQWVARERFTGSYLRKLFLGDGIDAEKISAGYRDGVLSLIMPIADRAKPRRIHIDALGEVHSETTPAASDSPSGRELAN
ncbi:Hsp20/alpha crystallin family protein [Nakamurella alba]